MHLGYPGKNGQCTLYQLKFFNASVVKTMDDRVKAAWLRWSVLQFLQSTIGAFLLHTSRAEILGKDHMTTAFLVTLAQPIKPRQEHTTLQPLRSTLLAIQFPTNSSQVIITPSVHLPSAFKRRPFSPQFISPQRFRHSTRSIAWPPWKIIRNAFNPAWKMIQTSSRFEMQMVKKTPSPPRYKHATYQNQSSKSWGIGTLPIPVLWHQRFNKILKVIRVSLLFQ